MGSEKSWKSNLKDSHNRWWNEISFLDRHCFFFERVSLFRSSWYLWVPVSPAPSVTCFLGTCRIWQRSIHPIWDSMKLEPETWICQASFPFHARSADPSKIECIFCWNWGQLEIGKSWKIGRGASLKLEKERKSVPQGNSYGECQRDRI